MTTNSAFDTTAIFDTTDTTKPVPTSFQGILGVYNGAPNQSGSNKTFVDTTNGGVKNTVWSQYTSDQNGTPVSYPSRYVAIHVTGNVWWNTNVYPTGQTYFQIYYFYTFSTSGGTTTYMYGSQNFRN